MCRHPVLTVAQCSFNFDSIFRRSDGKRDAETKKISTWLRVDIHESARTMCWCFIQSR